MNDSWCEALWYRGKKIFGGAARNARISSAGGMDSIIKNIATEAWNAATFAANQTDGGKIIQMPKKGTKVA